LSKLSFAFNIFVLIPVQEMVYLKVIQKNHPNGRFCVGNHRSKNVSEKFRGGFSLLSPPPLDPPMPSPKIKPQRKTASFTRKTTFFKECN